MRLLRPAPARAAALVLLLAACAGPAPDAGGSAPAPRALPKRDLVLVTLLTASPPPALDEASMGEAMRGHFANMRRLSEEGVLVLAGPLGEPRSDPRHRGLFVFDVPAVEDALALAGSDPSIQAGVFQTDACPLRSATPLARLPGMHRELERAQGPETHPGQNAKPYVIATGRVPEAELDRLAARERIVVAGVLGGARAGEALVVIDAASVPEARAALTAAGADPEAWTCAGFFASKLLPDLATPDAPR